jgi:DNA-directed RNA polymerase subunit RPC12/RpoP
MKCWNCNTNLIWGGDHDIEDSEEFDIESNFSCPDCGSFVLFYHAVTEASDE